MPQEATGRERSRPVYDRAGCRTPRKGVSDALRWSYQHRRRLEGTPREVRPGRGLASATERPLPGLISHYCMETDTGIRVVNCYETEEQLRAGYDATDFRDALQKAGFEFRPPQIMRVHNYFHLTG